jgi:hypothetical protein
MCQCFKTNKLKAIGLAMTVDIIASLVSNLKIKSIKFDLSTKENYNLIHNILL